MPALRFRFTCSQCSNNVEATARPRKVAGKPVCVSCTFGLDSAPTPPAAPARRECHGAGHVDGIGCERCDGSCLVSMAAAAAYAGRGRELPAARCWPAAPACAPSDLDPHERRLFRRAA